MDEPGTIKLYISTHIWVRSELPAHLDDQICEALTIVNKDKERALKEKIYRAEEMPDFLYLYERQNGKLILPRGFMWRLLRGLSEDGCAVKINNAMAKVPSGEVIDTESVALRDHQPEAVDALLQSKQGIYEAPTGSGKTVTMLDLIRRAGQRSLVIVNKKDTAEQWRTRSREFLGYEPGLIGDGVWDAKDFTIALQQSLWSRVEELDRKEFWRAWGLVCLDEMHHIPAETYMQTIQRFPAYYRFGISATPDREEWLAPVARAIIGDVVHKTAKREVKEIVKPEVVAVKTPFFYQFVATTVADDGQLERNNYNAMMKALTGNENRNGLVAEKILKEEGHCQLVISLRKGQLENIASLYQSIGGKDAIYFLTGKTPTGERMEIINSANDANCVIFSTLANEALDIPRVDRIHLAFPSKSAYLVTQQIGRGERAHPAKDGTIIYDYVDHRVHVLRGQFKARVNTVYRKEKMHIWGI